MWVRGLHTLAPLTKTKLTKVKFECTKIKQDACYEIKQIVACDNLLTYPDSNE